MTEPATIDPVLPYRPAGAKPDRLTADRMTTVDGLRAIAALAVILPHAWILFRDATEHPGPLASFIFFVRVQGTLGVQVFFVLSGFVIAYTLREARVTGRYWLRFLARRSIRLDPPYWASIAICCGVLWLGRHVAHDGSIAPTGREVLWNVAYLQQVVGCNDAVNHTYWTLCQEVQMYLAFCGAVGLLQLARVPYRPVLAVVAILGLSEPLGMGLPIATPGLFIRYAYTFLYGAAAWWAVERQLSRPMCMALLGIGGVAVSRHGDVSVGLTVAVATTLAVAGRSGDLYRWLAHRPLQWLGRASYGLYLLHNPVIWLALMAQHALGWRGLPLDGVLLVAVMAGSIAAAAVMHVTLERQCLRLARHLRGKPQPMIPS